MEKKDLLEKMAASKKDSDQMLFKKLAELVKENDAKIGSLNSEIQRLEKAVMGALCVKSFIQIIFRRNMLLGYAIHTYFHTGIPTYQNAFDR